MIRRPLVIVGAGPAGMAAAIATAECGLRPMLIDENARVGGQIYHQPSAVLKARTSSRHASTARAGATLLRRFAQCRENIEFMPRTATWGVFPPRKLAIQGASRWDMVEADQIILATGAYEYVPPFPGWTLPGVMTPGGAQRLVKATRVLPGRRVLVAGSGPFLLVVAEYLRRADACVVGVVEAAPAHGFVRSLPGLVASPGLLWEGIGYLYRVRRAGIPIYPRHVVIEARGDGAVREAVIAPCDAEWVPDRARARTLAVDTICVGYGFVPRVQLAQLAGCRLRFDDLRGGWIPEVDEDLESSVPGVFVAGDGGGIGGALIAELDGRLAGLACAHRLGAVGKHAVQRERRPLLEKRRRLRRFRAGLDALSRLRPGLSALATKDTIVCRCEELTLEEIDNGIAAGGVNLRTLKPMTRLTMGPCQGQMCWPALARHLAQRTGTSVEDAGPLSVRPPLQPLALGDLAAEGMAGWGEPSPEVGQEALT